jgi:hypothetical protein
MSNTENPEDAHIPSQFEVERVLGRALIDDRVHYQVKWLGSDELTWEPVENLQGVSWMIDEFEAAMNPAGSGAGAGLPNQTGDQVMAGTEDNNGFEGWGQELDDEYLQAEQNSIMQNQGLPIKEVI